jgi:hypothetical protein
MLVGNPCYMTGPSRPIFRTRALNHYIRKRDKDILPEFVSPPVFLFLWILFGLLLIAGLLAWWTEVPIYVAGSGIILEQGLQSKFVNNEGIVLIFLPAESAGKLRVGLPVQLYIGSTGPSFTSRIEQVEPGVISPSEVRKRYGLDSSVSQIFTEPSVVAVVKLIPTISAHMYAGSIVNAQVQVGSRRVLSLLPGFDRLIGD